jgi:dihydrofolate reductase
MRLSIIAALSRNRVIGRRNALPWHLPADLRRFRALTMGHPLIVGRRTFEAIGRPLPGRRMIVVSGRPRDWGGDVLAATSVEDAIDRARAMEEGEAFVGGGEHIFRGTLDLADRMYLTWVDADVEGDAYFPPYDEANWRTVESSRFPADERHAYPYSFVTYDRIT